MKRTTKLSKSATAKANNNGTGEAYLLVRELHALVHHPVLFNFHANRDAIRRLTSSSKKKFNRALKVALTEGLAWYRGDSLKFWSNNQDKAYKPAKKDDYIKTTNPKQDFDRIILTNYYNKQSALIRGKSKHTTNCQSRKDFDYQKKNAPISQHQINYAITLSCRAVAKLFNRDSPAYGHTKKLSLVKSGLINIHKNIVEISKTDAITAIKSGKPNVRRNKETDKWYFVLADTFDLGNKRKQPYCPKGTNYCNS